MMKMRKYRWDIGSVLPPEIKLNLCEQEVNSYCSNDFKFFISIISIF